MRVPSASSRCGRERGKDEAARGRSTNCLNCWPWLTLISFMLQVPAALVAVNQMSAGRASLTQSRLHGGARALRG